MTTRSFTGDKCPCCGAPVDKSAIVIDMQQNIALIGGKVRRFTPKEIEIIYVLHEAHPRAVSDNDLVRKIWGIADLNSNSLGVLISKLRRELREFEIEIVKANVDGHPAKLLKLPFTFTGRRSVLDDVQLPPKSHRGGKVQPEPQFCQPLSHIKRHGTYGYGRGCRCRDCVMAMREYQRNYQRAYYYALRGKDKEALEVYRNENGELMAKLPMKEKTIPFKHNPEVSPPDDEDQI